MKLERRQAQQQARRESGFSWPKLARLAGKALAFALAGTVVQFAALSAGIGFLSTLPGQMLVFGILYLLMFRWINSEFVGMRRPGQRPAVGPARPRARVLEKPRARVLEKR